jgi:hypothetical protein
MRTPLDRSPYTHVPITTPECRRKNLEESLKFLGVDAIGVVHSERSGISRSRIPGTEEKRDVSSLQDAVHANPSVSVAFRRCNCEGTG